MTERTRTSVLPLVEDTYENTRVITNRDVETVLESSGTFDADAGYSTMTDVVVENFHMRSKQGEIFINPMTSEVQRTIKSKTLYEGFTLSRTANYGYPYEWAYTGSYFRELEFLATDFSSLHQSNLCELALTSAFAENTSQKASSIVTLGEGKETVLGVVNVFQRVIRILVAVRKFQFKQLKKELHPSEIADFWMEIRYGIRPIVFDFMEIMDALQDTTKSGDRFTTRGFEAYAYEESDVQLDTGPSAYDVQTNRTTSLDYTVRAGCLSQVMSVGYRQLFGLTGAGVVLAIHDLTTLSFVWDWFINAGDTLAAHLPEADLKTLGAWTVETTVVKQTAELGGIVNLDKNYPPVHTLGNLKSEAPWERTTTTVVRTPRTSSSYIPRFKLNLNWAKLIDLSIIGRNIIKTLRNNDVRISRHGRIVSK